MKSYELKGNLSLNLRRDMSREEVEAEVSTVIVRLEKTAIAGFKQSIGEGKIDEDLVSINTPVALSIPYGPNALDIIKLSVSNIKAALLVEANNCVFGEDNAVANRVDVASDGFDIQRAAKLTADTKNN